MKKETFANWALCAVLGALAILALTRAGSALTPQGLLASDPAPSHEAQQMLREVKLVRPEIVIEAHNMVTASFYIQNNSAHAVKNIDVMCDFEDRHKRFLGRKFWKLNETLQPGQGEAISASAKMYLNKNVQKSKCSITDFRIEKEPFFTLDRRAAANHGASAEEGYGEPASGGH